MRGDTHVRFGGRARETDPGQPGHRARARPNRRVMAAIMPRPLEGADHRWSAACATFWNPKGHRAPYSPCPGPPRSASASPAGLPDDVQMLSRRWLLLACLSQRPPGEQQRQGLDIVSVVPIVGIDPQQHGEHDEGWQVIHGRDGAVAERWHGVGAGVSPY